MSTHDHLTLCRHALSYANRQGHEAFGSYDAGLDVDRGISQACSLGRKLETTYGIHPPTTPVATSKMMRSRDTALFAEFTELHLYDTLDELPTGCTTRDEWIFAKSNRILAAGQVAASAAMLEHYFDAKERDPALPVEEVWITHGYRIAHVLAAAATLGLTVERESETFIPAFCEVATISP